MSHIFVSYSRRDSDCVYKVVSELEDASFPIWIDRKRIDLSKKWFTEIEKGLDESFAFMLFWSKNSANSKYVKEEIDMVRSRITSGEVTLVLVVLDDTPVPTHLNQYQYADMTQGCDGLRIHNLIKQLDDSWRVFSYDKTLEQQNHTDVGDSPFVKVQYKVSPTGLCKAYIAGKAEARLPKSPTQLVVALQFTQAIDKNFIGEIHTSLEDDDLWYLNITGPESQKRQGSYLIDDNDVDTWEECRAFVNTCIAEIADASSTQLKFFALMPSVLLGAITTQYGRFWNSEYYNWTGNNDDPYVKVLELNRNR